MASRGINKVILVGNIGQDPDVHVTQQGATITTISVATSESWKDKSTGEQKAATEWHRVVFFNRLGEIAAEYLKKGSKVYVEGSLRTRKWQDQQGVERYTTEIVANEMQMLDGRSGMGGGNQDQSGYAEQDHYGSAAGCGSNQGVGSYGGGHSAPSGHSNTAPSRESRRPPEPPPQSKADFDGFDDDIPF